MIEIFLFIGLFIYNLLIVSLADKIKNIYISRKFIHIFSGGVSFVLFLFFFQSRILPVVLSSLMLILTILGHLTSKKKFRWQIEGDFGDIYFCMSAIILITLFWKFAILPLLFMAWGDGISGIARNRIYKRMCKGWWGTVAMLGLCSLLGFLFLGWIGILGGIFATLVERYKKINDNLSVPFGSALILFIGMI